MFESPHHCTVWTWAFCSPVGAVIGAALAGDTKVAAPIAPITSVAVKSSVTSFMMSSQFFEMMDWRVAPQRGAPAVNHSMSAAFPIFAAAREPIRVNQYRCEDVDRTGRTLGSWHRIDDNSVCV